jgi:hypothetical protein
MTPLRCSFSNATSKSSRPVNAAGHGLAQSGPRTSQSKAIAISKDSLVYELTNACGTLWQQATDSALLPFRNFSIKLRKWVRSCSVKFIIAAKC